MCGLNIQTLTMGAPKTSTEGIPCPNCGSKISEVVNTRDRDGYIWRRRKCYRCREKFTTNETALSENDKRIIKKIKLKSVNHDFFAELEELTHKYQSKVDEL